MIALALSELRSLVTKAARGAGLDWGLAEEAGWAAEWLARRDLPAADWAADWLEATLRGAIGPVEFGTALADRLAGPAPLGATEPLPRGLAAPGYLLPFLHRIAARHGALDILSPTGPVACLHPNGAVAFGPNWAATSQNWWLARATARPADPPAGARPQIAAPVLAQLEALALRTTVPPSAQSRRDAGSMASDND